MYSTCSFAVEENEEVVDYVCKNRYVKIIDTGLQIESRVYKKFGEKRFNDRMKYCIRVFPHIHNLDGFFICKLKKIRDGERTLENDQKFQAKKVSNEKKNLVRKKKIEKKLRKQEKTK